MAQEKYAGAQREYEVNSQRRRKDPRLLSRRVSDYFRSPEGVVAGLFILPVLAIIFIRVPLMGEIVLFAFVPVYYQKFIKSKGKKQDFPIRVPEIANVLDGSERIGSGLGKGITYMGNEIGTKEPIYASNTDMKTHMMVLGTTGSGKTELLLALVYNALVQNTGLIFSDGKGTAELYEGIFRLARSLGREDDILLINFITSGRDFFEKQKDKVTNTLNFMGNTSSGTLIELLVSLLDGGGGKDEGGWRGRAIAYIGALTRPLIYLNDKGHINLSPATYIEYFDLNKVDELAYESTMYGEDFEIIVEPLRAFLVSLGGGYSKTQKGQHTTTAVEQFGYVIQQLTRAFNDLSYNYGHIFQARIGDVDFYDLVLNRRILVVLLPSLDRSPDSLKMLGKLIVGSIKQMLAGTLGNRVEGSVRDIIHSKPTNAPVPYYIILDEYAYYHVDGFSVAPAQARGLGISIVFGMQDLSSLEKTSAAEAEEIWANTNIRAVGRMTVGTDSYTWKKVSGAAGEVEELVASGRNKETDGVFEHYRDSGHVSYEKRSRINYDDMSKQADGDFTFLVGKKQADGRGGVRLIRARGFYVKPQSPKEIRLNDLLPLSTPAPNELSYMEEFRKKLSVAVLDGSLNSMIVNGGGVNAVAYFKEISERFSASKIYASASDNNLVALSVYNEQMFSELTADAARLMRTLSDFCVTAKPKPH